MIRRKRNLIFTQLILFIFGLTIIVYTYFNNKEDNYELISKDNQSLINKNKNNNDVFYNIKYSGVDLAGNRYILSSKEATNNRINQDLVNMRYVEVTFYFKDETILNVKSDFGKYNNKTLDMIFESNVKAFYEGSKLSANKANYSNINSYLTISDNVIVSDQRGTVVADKLLFDIKNQNLDIISFKENKINARIGLK